ncbi:N-acetyltransferase [Massilia forsythiae]|uniref:N-acetyltransferase n=1 Tax=Massilia forsythiae TaxID=2728020 RepID=A0A7Z2W169_9BURK|nr:N-acetyltransferase [Massilia forsythiae]
MRIRAAGGADLAPFFAYLEDHLRDNGTGGTPLFQPLPPGQSSLPGGVRLSFIKGLDIAVGQPGWRRLWLALGPTGSIAGHIDLRSRPEMAAAHRAMLGMGVHRLYRRRGLGTRLLATAADWAGRDAGLAWIDLEVLAHNRPAVELYARNGFTTLACIADMLRIDGASYDLSYMTRALR